MSLCTFGFYEVYWFLKQWRFLRDSGEPDLKVLPRAIFSGLFAYPLFRRIRDHAKELDLGVGWDPGLLAAGYVLLALAFRLPGPLFLLGFSNVVFLLPVQQTMHRINSRYPPSPPPDHSYSGWNIATVMLGSILLFFVVVGSFLK